MNNHNLNNVLLVVTFIGLPVLLLGHIVVSEFSGARLDVNSKSILPRIQLLLDLRNGELIQAKIKLYQSAVNLIRARQMRDDEKIKAALWFDPLLSKSRTICAAMNSPVAPPVLSVPEMELDMRNAKKGFITKLAWYQIEFALINNRYQYDLLLLKQLDAGLPGPPTNVYPEMDKVIEQALELAELSDDWNQPTHPFEDKQ